MAKACPIPTAAERQYDEIRARIEKTLIRKVHEALRDAAEQARTEIQEADLDWPPPSSDVFAAIIHQSLYCTLCKADPDTFEGGKAEIALAIIRNSQNIAKHYWGADIAPYPAN